VGLCAGTGLRLSVRSCSLVQHGQIAYASRHELTQLWLLHADQPGPGDRPLLGYHEDQAHLPAARNPKQEKRRAMRRQGTKRTIPCGPRTPSQPVGPRMPRSPGSPGSPCFPCGPVAPEGPRGPGPPTGPCNATARTELDTQRMDGDTNWMGLAALSVFHQQPSWRIKNKGDTAQTQKHTDTATARTCTRITRTFTTRTRTASTRRAHKHTPTSACAQTRTRTQGEWLRMRSNTSAPARPGSPGGPGLPGSPCSPGGPWGPDCPSSPTSPGCPR
jgi:hypothetical protein